MDMVDTSTRRPTFDDRLVAGSGSSDGQAMASLRVPLEIRVRQCHEGDLPAMEWHGLFAHDRDAIRETFVAQSRGDAIMLVAVTAGGYAGQIWLDLGRLAIDGTGLLWALRVWPCLRGLGIGTWLLRGAEDTLRRRGFRRAELSVETSNTAALRLYERLGYRAVPTVAAGKCTVTQDPVPIRVPASQYLMRRCL